MFHSSSEVIVVFSARAACSSLVLWLVCEGHRLNGVEMMMFAVRKVDCIDPER